MLVQLGDSQASKRSHCDRIAKNLKESAAARELARMHRNIAHTLVK
jgi:hypothetical protein